MFNGKTHCTWAIFNSKLLHYQRENFNMSNFSKSFWVLLYMIFSCWSFNILWQTQCKTSHLGECVFLTTHVWQHWAWFMVYHHEMTGVVNHRSNYRYPLVNYYRYGKWPIYSWFAYSKWWSSIVMLVYQRVVVVYNNLIVVCFWNNSHKTSLWMNIPNAVAKSHLGETLCMSYST